MTRFGSEFRSGTLPVNHEEITEFLRKEQLVGEQTATIAVLKREIEQLKHSVAQ